MKSLITIDKYQKRDASFFRLSWIGWYIIKEKITETLLKRQEKKVIEL
jgi:hypothetical protein